MRTTRYYGRLSVCLLTLPLWIVYFGVSFTVVGCLEGLGVAINAWLSGWMALRRSARG